MLPHLHRHPQKRRRNRGDVLVLARVLALEQRDQFLAQIVGAAGFADFTGAAFAVGAGFSAATLAGFLAFDAFATTGEGAGGGLAASRASISATMACWVLGSGKAISHLVTRLVGQLTIEVEWLEKKSRQKLDLAA